jgi:sec-independent protein translocase protein TatA
MLATYNVPGLMGFIIPNLGVQELLIILVIAVLIFGGKKIPEVAKGLGQGIRQFKDSLKSGAEDEPPVDKAGPAS